MLLQIILAVDSTIISKLDKLSQSFDALQKKVTLSPWLSIAAAVVGGILVWIGQHLDRRAKKKQELYKEVYETFSKCEMVLLSLKNLLRELSTQRNLKRFWWYSYEGETNDTNKNIELEKLYYNNCITCSDLAIKCNLKIGESLAEYYSQVSKFNILTNSIFDISFIKNLITHNDLNDAKELELGLSNELALEKFRLNNFELIKEYLRPFEPIDQLNENLRITCNKFKT